VCDISVWVDGWRASSRPASFTIQHLYGYNSNSLVKMNSVTTALLENSIMDSNYEDAVNCHGEDLAMNDVTSYTIRYNQFINCVGTGCIATPCGTCSPSGVEIYGNVFATDGKAGVLSDGVIVALSGGGFNPMKVYNNTIANWPLGQLRITPLNFIYNSGGTVANLDVENNLFYNNADTIVVNQSGGVCKSNSFYSTNRVSTACTGDQTGGTGNLFVNGFSDWHLVTDTSTLSMLASPYNTDPDGVSRSTSRGAYQFMGGGSQTVSAPTGLSVIVN